MNGEMAIQNTAQLSFAKNKQLNSPKGTGGFTVRFLFFAFFKKLFKKVLTNRECSVIMITEIKGSDRTLEAKYD